MFEFTTQTVLNSLDAVRTGGEGQKPQLRIGNARFDADDVEHIYRQAYSEEKFPSVEFNLANITTSLEGVGDKVAGIYRIAIYLGLSMNSQDSFYANDMVYKGKPLYIEFPIKNETPTAADANKAKSIADKYMLFTAQDKVLNVTTEDAKIKFEGVSGYQQIKKAVLQKFDPDAIQIDCCSTDGDYVTIIEGIPATWKTAYDLTDGGVITVDNKGVVDGKKNVTPGANQTLIKPGIEAFGDYNWIIHNLRLPTYANSYFWSPTRTEMPAVGGKYVQYIIQICKDRDGIAGEVVGQRAHSVTNHVFWVPLALAEEFEGAAADTESDPPTEASGLNVLKAIETPAETELADPFANLPE